jgi:hypothetical protein
VNPVRQGTELELAYAAGIVDGEGCIILYKSNNTTSQPKLRKPGDVRYRYKVQVKMVDPEAVTLFMEIFGGSIYMQYPKSRANFPQYTWLACERRAASCIKQILPYLRIKKARGVLLLNFCENISKSAYKGRGYRVPEEDAAKREEIISQVKLQNQRTRKREDLGMLQ